ncbi:Crp/Fnr family transcriptional regulator [Flagellimonas sp.]|uniref:Crp/Fnr family transcriptional regulator n=1 Tax=Flagellimonas sp. TaxID=2058762 RepID=UPI003BB0C3DD
MVRADKYITSKNLIEWNIEHRLGLTTRSIKKGELLLEAGQRCDYFYFVLKGFIRIYYLDLDGNEITHWFSSENSMITSPFSFLKREENILFFEALEDTELILITSEQLNTIISQFQSTEKAFRNLYAEFAMVLSRRVIGIQTETAEERYLKLMKEHPYLFQKAKLGHIASYLGITAQSLSRIRKNL